MDKLPDLQDYVDLSDLAKLRQPEIEEICLQAFTFIGLTYVFLTLLSWTYSFYKHFLRCSYNLKSRYNSNTPNTKSWVAITGATGSLGFSYAKEFARRGFNLLLIARNMEKATESISKLQELYPDCSVTFLPCDLSWLATQKKELDTMKRELKEILKNKDICMLINNAAVISVESKFGDEKLEKNMQIVNVNIIAGMILSQLLIPYFENRNNRSCIVNIGSGVAYNKFPGFNIYGSSKAFLEYMTVTASKEYQNSNIDFSCIHPGTMVSAMSGMKQNIFMGVIDTDRFVRSSMAHIGKSRVITGWWYHALFFKMLGSLHTEIALPFAQSIMVPFFKSLMNH